MARGVRVRMVAPQPNLRDRLDAQVRGGVIGMLGPGASDGPAEFVPIGNCPAAAPAVRAWLRDLIDDPPPLPRASIRLRVAPEGSPKPGLKGLWIDADRDVLADLTRPGSAGAAWAQRQLDAGVVLEVGQRSEALAMGPPGSLVRRPASRHPWFLTRAGHGRLPLETRIADFTQPSVAGNLLLLDVVAREVAAHQGDAWVELGAGAGNMTLSLLLLGRRVRAIELGTEALEHNLARFRERLGRGQAKGRGATALAACEPRAGSLGHPREVGSWLLGHGAVLADPPRSGLGAFAEALPTLSPGLRPSVIVYVSCWLDALSGDAKRLEAAGYRLVRATGVEQFRDSPEVEWVTVWAPA